MNENDILTSKFKASGYAMISEFIRGTGSQVSQEMWGRVLKRGKTVNADMLLRIAGELGCTPEEIRTMMLARGEKTIARLIAPSAITAEDQRFLDELHQLKTEAKKKIIFDMLDSLKG